MRTPSEDALGNVLFGKAKRAILSQLFGSPDKRFFVRELARGVGLTPSTLTRDLSALTKVGLIRRTEEGRQVYYQANENSPIFAELRGIVSKTFGVADVLRSMLVPVAKRIRFATIYGSIAKGEHDSASDVDLLVVGELKSSDFARRLLDAERQLGRSINPTTYSFDQFESLASHEGFVRNILDQPMIFLTGNQVELERLRKNPAKKPR